MTVELKPCPFCGGEAHLCDDTSHSTAYFIGCSTLDCFGEMLWAETRDEAIAGWNTRATPDPLSDPRVKALVEAVEGALFWAPDNKNSAYWRRRARAALRAIEEGGK